VVIALACSGYALMGVMWYLEPPAPVVVADVQTAKATAAEALPAPRLNDCGLVTRTWDDVLELWGKYESMERTGPDSFRANYNHYGQWWVNFRRPAYPHAGPYEVANCGSLNE